MSLINNFLVVRAFAETRRTLREACKELRGEDEVDVLGLRIRNVIGSTATRAKGLCITVADCRLSEMRGYNRLGAYLIPMLL